MWIIVMHRQRNALQDRITTMYKKGQFKLGQSINRWKLASAKLLFAMLLYKTPISSVDININVQINAFVYFHIITITILNPNNLMCPVRGFADDHVH